MCAGILVLEAIVLGLTAPVLVVVEDRSLALALSVGLGMAAACVVTAGLLRAEWAYLVGFAIQLVAVALGFLVPAMFFLGALFGLLWATAYFLGRKIERERAAAYAAYEAESE